MAHTLPTHKKGDTFPGEIFVMQKIVDEVPQAINLEDVHIRMDLRLNPTSAIVRRFTNYDTLDPLLPGGGLTITDAPNGTWQIDPQILDLPPKTYVYDVEFTFPTGFVQTYIDGTWTFTQDVTHD